MSPADIFTAARHSPTPFTILGATGFIGSHLVTELTRQKIPHRAIKRGDESAFGAPLGHVIYAIGLTADYSRWPLETAEAHVGVLSLVLAKGMFESLVYLSSTRLYDGLVGDALEGRELSLNPANPRHVFDLSKALGEALCLHATSKARVARLSSVYAANLAGPNFLHTIVRAAARRERRPLATRLDSARDYIDIEDVMPALLAIALYGEQKTYNVASGENVTNEQIFTQLSSLGGGVLSAAGRQFEEKLPLINIGAMTTDFGFRPRRLTTRLPLLFDHATREVAGWGLQ